LQGAGVQAGRRKVLRNAAAQAPSHGVLATVIRTEYLFQEQAQGGQRRVHTVTVLRAVALHQSLELLGIKPAS